MIVLVVVVVGAYVAWTFVGAREVPATAPSEVSFVTRAARAELYGDAFNDEVLLKPGVRGIDGMVAFDTSVVDGAAMNTGRSFMGLGTGLRLVQNGYARSYALSLLGGAALVVLALLVVSL